MDVLFFDVELKSIYHRTALFVSIVLLGLLASRNMVKEDQLKIKEIQNKAQSYALSSKAIQERINELIPISKTDKRGVITYANDAYANLTGYTVEELVGQKHDILRHPSTPKSFYKQMWQTIAKGDAWEGEILNIGKDGVEFFIHTYIMPEYDSAGRRIGYLAIRSNVTDKKILERIASEDALTGVLNRREFDRRLTLQVKESVRYGVEFSLIYLDIDYFKQINDRFGHLTGDEVLKRFSTLISQRLRETDIFARIGGEEFAVILPHSDGVCAMDIAEVLRETIATQTFPEVEHVTASFGVVQFQMSDSSSSLMRKADKALYNAKSSGRNCVRNHWNIADDSKA